MKNVIEDLMDSADYGRVTNEFFSFALRGIQERKFTNINEDVKDMMYVDYINDCNRTRIRPLKRRLFNKVVDSIMRRKETIKTLLKNAEVA